MNKMAGVDATAELSALRRQLEQLSNEIGTLRDVHAVRRLQHAYGYYLDKCLYDEVVDLSCDSGEVRFMGGIFKGKAGVKRLYCDRFRQNFTGGHNGPVYGFLLDHRGSPALVTWNADRLASDQGARRPGRRPRSMRADVRGPRLRPLRRAVR